MYISSLRPKHVHTIAQLLKPSLPFLRAPSIFNTYILTPAYYRLPLLPLLHNSAWSTYLRQRRRRRGGEINSWFRETCLLMWYLLQTALIEFEPQDWIDTQYAQICDNQCILECVCLSNLTKSLPIELWCLSFMPNSLPSITVNYKLFFRWTTISNFKSVYQSVHLSICQLSFQKVDQMMVIKVVENALVLTMLHCSQP